MRPPQLLGIALQHWTTFGLNAAAAPDCETPGHSDLHHDVHALREPDDEEIGKIILEAPAQGSWMTLTLPIVFVFNHVSLLSHITSLGSC